MFKESNEVNALQTFTETIRGKFQETIDAIQATRAAGGSGEQFQKMSAAERATGERVEEEVAELTAEALTSMNYDDVMKVVYAEMKGRAYTHAAIRMHFVEKILKYAAEKLLTQQRPE